MVRKGTEHTRKVGEIKIGWGIFVFTPAVSHISIVIRNNYVLLDSLIHNVVIVNLWQIHHDSFDTAFHLVSVMSKPVINKISFQIFVIHVSLYFRFDKGTSLIYATPEGSNPSFALLTVKNPDPYKKDGSGSVAN
jgi:hypothetical protein